jgi:hypothetical protein
LTHCHLPAPNATCPPCLPLCAAVLYIYADQWK